MFRPAKRHGRPRTTDPCEVLNAIPYLARTGCQWLTSIRSAFAWLRHVFAAGGYAGPKPTEAVAKLGTWTLEMVTRSDTAKGFVPLPRRWVVERTFAWFGRNRRLAKDFEKTIESAEAWLPIAGIQLLTRRIARA